MGLREQILNELKIQNNSVQSEIDELKEKIRAERLLQSGSRGLLASIGYNACESRIQSASNRRDRLEHENEWLSEMLSKYR